MWRTWTLASGGIGVALAAGDAGGVVPVAASSEAGSAESAGGGVVATGAGVAGGLGVGLGDGWL
jgi:hypothetical protein